MVKLISNCCSAPMNEDMGLCPECFEGCEAIEEEEQDYMETWLLDK